MFPIASTLFGFRVERSEIDSPARTSLGKRINAFQNVWWFKIRERKIAEMPAFLAGAVNPDALLYRYYEEAWRWIRKTLSRVKSFA